MLDHIPISQGIPSSMTAALDIISHVKTRVVKRCRDSQEYDVLSCK
jgi:hypothetical protein